MEFTVNSDITILVSGLSLLLFLCSLPWLSRHTDFLSMLRHHLRRFAPLYLVAGPAAITYFAVTPCAALTIEWIFFSIHKNVPFHGSQEYANQHGLYTLFHCAELLASFVGSLFFAWLIRWVGLSRLWTGMLFVSMSICAAYRTARVGTGPDFGSGPQILLSPQWLDAIPVVLGLGVYWLLCQKSDRRQRVAAVVSS